MLQRLETRRLLAASIDSGTLNVTGTSGNDTILLVPVGDGSQVLVTVNGSSQQFARSSISKINISGLEGNDYIEYQGPAGETRPIERFVASA